jgi:hypothetical protein
MSASVKVDNRLAIFTQVNEAAMERALERMGNDIHIIADFKVPMKDGTLKDSGEHIRIGRLHRRVQYGDKGAQAYASYQHRGMRKDGSHIVRNYTTSGTNKHFLSDAGQVIAPKSGQYFKREFESVRV